MTVRRTILAGLLVIQTVAGGLLLVHGAPSPHRGDTAGYDIDIGRLAELRNTLPAGYSVDVQSPHLLDQRAVDQAVADARAVSATPPECATPTDVSVGTAVTAVAASGTGPGFIVTATQSPQPGAEAPVPDTCRNFTTERPDGTMTVAQTIAGPPIADATTRGTHSTVAVEETRTGEMHAVDQYVYTARLDDRHVVSVTSSANPRDSGSAGAQAARLLADAVGVIRRRT
jgi:Domain of unknown function (DUF5642)